jgi:hypothetical protein
MGKQRGKLSRQRLFDIHGNRHTHNRDTQKHISTGYFLTCT